MDKFRFTPRIQHINELEAGTRAKLKFYERLTKLFESQGTKLKVPTVEKEILDLAKLHKVPLFSVNERRADRLFFRSLTDCQRRRWLRRLLFAEEMGACRTTDEFSRFTNLSRAETALREAPAIVRCL